MNRKLIVVGTLPGGPGKTTVATFLAEMHRTAGRNFAILDADDKNRTPAGESALAHALPHHSVLWLGTGPSVAEMEANSDVGNGHWDKVRSVLEHQDVILDLGANTVQRFAEYALRMRAAQRWAEDGISVEFWVPFTNDRITLESGVMSLNQGGKAFGGNALRAVRNLRDGDFSGWDGTPQGAALAALENAGIAFVDLPRAPIPPDGLKAMKKGPWSAFQVRAMGRRDAASKLGLPGPIAERTVYGCEDWIEAVSKSWGDLVSGGNG